MTARDTFPGIRKINLLDVAPTAAKVLGINLPQSDGLAINVVEGWGCRNVVLIIVDSLGYDLYRWLYPHLANISALAKRGVILEAEAVSNHTSPAIATILSGLLPEHHKIFDKQRAKESSLLSIPEIASASGLKAAVIMEKNGAEVYSGLIEIVRGVPDDLAPEEFDRWVCCHALLALSEKPRLLVSYFIGIDKAAHMGLGPAGIRNAAVLIDRCVGEMVAAADDETLFILCGDHPVHAGILKRTRKPCQVALILAKGRARE
jgi:predicted AlkP superfamily pyrophosphatase or phosphodiesterase